jgi:hypothetical protein
VQRRCSKRNVCLRLLSFILNPRITNPPATPARCLCGRKMVHRVPRLGIKLPSLVYHLRASCRDCCQIAVQAQRSIICQWPWRRSLHCNPSGSNHHPTLHGLVYPEVISAIQMSAHTAPLSPVRMANPAAGEVSFPQHSRRMPSRFQESQLRNPDGGGTHERARAWS